MRIGIAGYGNLGRAVEELAKKQTDRVREFAKTVPYLTYARWNYNG